MVAVLIKWDFVFIHYRSYTLIHMNAEIEINRNEVARCCAILKSGPRVGLPCNQPAVTVDRIPGNRGQPYCRRHAHQTINTGGRRPANLLCSFDRIAEGVAEGAAKGVLIRDLLDLATANTLIPPKPEDEPYLEQLRGYINLRVGPPLLFEGTIPLVLFTEGTLQGHGPPFTAVLLAHELAKSIAYILSRPDVYILAPNASLETLRLLRIEFDPYWHMFKAVME